MCVGVAAGGGEDAGDDGDVLAEAEADGVADVDAEGVGEGVGEADGEGLGEAVGDLDECTDGDADALAG